MNTNDLAEFTEMLTTLGVFYRMPLEKKSIELYWGALVRFELAEIKTAFEAHLRDPDTGQYFPKPADVMRYTRGGGKTQALRAWSNVMDTMSGVGSYASVVFDDALIHAVIEEMGGWVSLCHTLLKNLPFRAHDFEKRYAAYVLHPPLRYPKQLAGLEEQHNRMNGQAVQPPLLIGNTEDALAVFHGGSEKPLAVVRAPEAALSASECHLLSESLA